MGSQPANNDLVTELRDELMEARRSFPSAGELIVKGGLYISRDRAEHMRSKIAPLVRRLNSDKAWTALGEARQFAALGECFVYLHWVLQAVGAPSAAFRSYAHHYLTSAISLLENREDDESRDAAEVRAQVWRADIESLRALLNTYLDMPIRLITETEYSEPSPPAAPSAPESRPPMPWPKPSAPQMGEGAPSGSGLRILRRLRGPGAGTPGPAGKTPNPPARKPTGRAARLVRRIAEIIQRAVLKT